MPGLNQKDIDVLAHYAAEKNRELYWNYLAHKEGNDGYGLLALGVVRNDNAPGATANTFADNRARSDGIRLSEREWNSFGVDLMQSDLERRQVQMRQGRPDLALNLPVKDVKEVHDFTFQSRKIDPNAWTPRELLEAAHRHGGDNEAEKVWSMMLDNSRLGLDRAGLTMRDVARYDDAQLDAVSYVARMGLARGQAHYALANTDPDRIGATNFTYVYDRKTNSWDTHTSVGGQYSIQPVRDPEQIRQLNDTRELRLQLQQRRQQFHPDDPYRNEPIMASPQTLADAEPLRSERGPVLAGGLVPSQPGHPRHDLYRQCLDGVHALDQQMGRSPDEKSACMAASLTDLAARNGLQRVDQVVLSVRSGEVHAGQNVFVVQGNLGDPAHLRAHMPTDEAVRTPAERSFERLAELDQHLAREQSLQAETRQRDAQSHAAAVMRI